MIVHSTLVVSSLEPLQLDKHTATATYPIHYCWAVLKNSKWYTFHKKYHGITRYHGINVKVIGIKITAVYSYAGVDQWGVFGVSRPLRLNLEQEI